MANDPIETPTLYDVIKDVVDETLVDIHTSMPGMIESFDKATCLASVVPSLKRRLAVTDEVIELPVIQNVPVLFPRGGGAAITFDLQKGDPVWLVFSERSIDLWISKGGKVDPRDPRKFSLSDAIAIPGVYPKSTPVADSLIKMDFSKDGSLTVKNGKGSLALDQEGKLEAQNDSLRVTFGNDGKFEVFGKSSSVGFVAQLLMVLDKFMQTTKVATSMGLQPFIPDASYTSERAKLDSFKE